MSSNPISSDLNSRRDDVFSQGSHDRLSTRGFNAVRTGNSPGHALHKTGSQPPVNVLQAAFSRQFSRQAAVKDSFHQLMRQTFSRIADPETTDTAPKYNYSKAEALRQQALEGDLSWLPEVKVLSNSEFSKAQFNGQHPSPSGTPLGAFGDDTIMLNESVFSDPGLALRVYSEEAGQALDKVLNQDVDSAGDEGAIFQKLLSGEKISAEQMKALKAENDHGVLNNKEVEFRGFQYSEAQLIERIKWASGEHLHYDPSVYYNEHADVQKMYEYDQGRGQVPQAGGIIGIFNHWTKHGINEGRRASLEFDPAYYVKQNPTLKGKGHREVYNHWINHGIKNGLKGSADFDIKYYLSKYRDQIKDYAEKNSISYGSPKITTQAERDNFNAFVHWRKEGREKGLIGTLASDIKVNIFAVAYKNASDGLGGAVERYGRLDKAFANREKDNAALDKVVTEVAKFNKSMTKPELSAAIATMNRAGVEAHLKGDIKRIVALAAHSEAHNIKGAKALNETLKKSIADQDSEAFNEVAAKIIDQRKGPKVTIKWIDGALTQWYAKLDSKDKAKVDTDTAAFIASIARTKVEAYIKGDIKHMVAIAAFSEAHSAKGSTAAKELNDDLKEGIANKDAEAIDKAATKMIGYLKNSKISNKWVDEKVDWYAKQTFPDKTKVDANATAFNTQQYLIGDVNRLVAVAAQNEVAGKAGAKAQKAELLESIVNRDNAAATKIGLKILEKNPDLTTEKIDGLVNWHKGYVDKIQSAQTHLMKDARRMLALATHNEVNGVEGGKSRNDALKESFANKDLDAFTKVASEIVVENPHLSVKWINETLTPWYANDYKSDDKASLETSAIAFNAIIGRAKTEAYFLGDIERLIAVASQNEVAGKEGAKGNKAELFKSVANNDKAAVAKIGQEILELNPDLTTKRIDGLVSWHKNYVTQIQDAQAHLMKDAKRMLALATHNEVNGVEGGKARNDALKESFANKDLKAFNKVASEIVVENPHLSVKWINETLAKWYADYEGADKASLDASATAFNATIDRAKTEAYIKDDIKHLVALAAHSENAGVEGAKELNETLKKSIEAKDYEAIDQVASKIIDQRTGPEITIKWVDKDLTQWYANQTFADKGKVDTDITALKADRRRLDAINKNVVAIAYQDLAQDEEGAKVRWTNLKEGLESKDVDDGAALEKATKAIVASNKGMSIAEVDQAVVEYTKQTNSTGATEEDLDMAGFIIKLYAVAYQDIKKGKKGAETRMANMQKALDNAAMDKGEALAKAMEAITDSAKSMSVAELDQAVLEFGALPLQPSRAETEKFWTGYAVYALAYQNMTKGEDGAEVRWENLQKGYENIEKDQGASLNKAMDAIRSANKDVSIAELNQAVDEYTEKFKITDQPKTESAPGVSEKDKNMADEVSKLKQTFQSRFVQTAKNAESFHTLMSQAFGSTYDHDAAEKIRESALNNDFAWLPDTEVLGNDVFANANVTGFDSDSVLSDSERTNNIYAVPGGAFDGNSILLNELVLSDSELANKVYAEEAGHALDKLINQGVDAKGDEGAIFQKVLFGEDLSAEQLDTLKAENDQGTLADKPVEFFSFGGFVSGITSGIGSIVGSIGRGIGNIGSSIGNIAGSIGRGIGNIGSSIGHGIINIGAGIGDFVNQQIINPIKTSIVNPIKSFLGLDKSIAPIPAPTPTIDIPSEVSIDNNTPLGKDFNAAAGEFITPDFIKAGTDELITPDSSDLDTSINALTNNPTSVDKQFGQLTNDDFGMTPDFQSTSFDPTATVNQVLNIDGGPNLGENIDQSINTPWKDVADGFASGLVLGDNADGETPAIGVGQAVAPFVPGLDKVHTAVKIADRFSDSFNLVKEIPENDFGTNWNKFIDHRLEGVDMVLGETSGVNRVVNTGKAFWNAIPETWNKWNDLLNNEDGALGELAIHRSETVVNVLDAALDFKKGSSTDVVQAIFKAGVEIKDSLNGVDKAKGAGSGIVHLLTPSSGKGQLLQPAQLVDAVYGKINGNFDFLTQAK